MKKSLAIQALRKEIQKIAFDANLWDKGIATYPYSEICSKRRKELLKEIERLEKEEQNENLRRANSDNHQ